jgi:PTS system galactitol-specific IIC component
MNLVLSGINWFGHLPSSVMMFLIFLVINLVLRISPGKAIRSAFLYAMGLFALSTFAFSVFLGTVVDVANAMIKNLGLKMTVVDFGTGIMPIFLQNPIVVWAIPIGLALNILMLVFKLTKTLNVDIWNMLYFWGCSGVLVLVVTGNTLFAVLAIIITGVMSLKVADWTAPHLHKVLPQYKGLSFPYVYSAFYAPVAYWFNKLFDKIPFVRNSNVSAESVRNKFGVLGEPGLIGFFLGIIMAILGKYSFAGVLETGIKLGASLHFVPLSVKIIIQGLSETTAVLTEWVKGKFKDREIYIGLDGVLVSGLPETLAVGLLFVPIALLVSIILPGNKVLPVGMLSVGFILVGLFMPFFKMNILKGAIFCFIVAACELYIGTLLAPPYTQMAIQAGYDIPYGAVQITNAGNFPFLVNVKLFELVQYIISQFK